MRQLCSCLPDRVVPVALALISLVLLGPSPARTAEAPADTAATLVARIDTLRWNGQYADALDRARQLLAVRQRDPRVKPHELDDARRLVQALGAVASFPDSQKAELARADAAQPQIDQLRARGAYADGAVMAAWQLGIRARILGDEHPDVATSLNSLAKLDSDQGRYAKAESLFQRALAMREKILGPDHPDVATSLNDLAGVYMDQGQYAQAEPLYLRALTVRERTLGSDHPYVARTLQCLGSLYYHEGVYGQAEPLLQRAQAIFERAAGPDGIEVAMCLNGLGGLYLAEARYSQAESMLTRALAIWEKHLGPDHPLVASSLSNLHVAYQALGQYAQAQPVCARALAIREKALGPNHPDVAVSLANLGALYVLQGKYARAEPLYKRSLTSLEEALGKNHPRIAQILDNLAGVYVDQGRYAQAEPLFIRSLIISEKALGPDHPDVATHLASLADLYIDQGQFVRAKPFLDRALAIREKALGPDHPDVGASLGGLAHYYSSQDEVEQAEALFQRSLAVKEKALGPVHPVVAQSLSNLATSYATRGQYARAESLMQRSLAIWEKALGPDHPDVAPALFNLACIYNDQGRYEKAESLYRRSVAIWTNAISPDVPMVTSGQRILAIMLLARGDASTAESLLVRAAASYEIERLRLARGPERATFRMPPYPFLAEAELFLGHAEQAWPAVERGLGRTLFDLLSTSAQRPLSPMEVMREDSLSGLLANLESQLTACRSAAAKDTTGQMMARAEEARIHMLDAEARWTGFRQEMAAKYPVAEGQAYDLSRVQSALAQDDAIIGWLDAKGDRGVPVFPSWGYVVRRGGPVEWYRLRDRASGPDVSSSSAPPDSPASLLRKKVCRRPVVGELPQTEARALYIERLAPLMGSLEGIERLIVIPSGEMLGVPVEALVMNDSGELVGEHFAVSYVPSATIHTWLRERAEGEGPMAVRENGAGSAARRTARCLALGDPPFSSEQFAAMSSGSANTSVAAAASNAISTASFSPSIFLPLTGFEEPQRGGDDLLVRNALAGNRDVLQHLKRLPATRTEARAIADLCGAGSRLLLGPEATEQELARMAEEGELKQYRILHIATHTLVDDQRPENSALILSQVDLPDPMEAAMAGARIYDGCVSAAEILREWKLKADLVTLSGCETGLGQKVSGEGYVGLAHAFLQAGARSLLVSLWRVEDQSTSILMRRFYEDLLGQYSGVRGSDPGRAPGSAMSKVEALREAKSWLREWRDQDGKRPYAHPFYWAGFILMGGAE
jgi:CHAT domain-containing protein/tetratricopeptide (TPR) repeat protein